MFFSVIIPIYNVSKYIERGFASIMAQTFNDFEIIMVDDGSTDNSGEIIDNLAEKYPNKLKVYHQENTGAGGARNNAISHAIGKYVAFFDIDDEVYSNWLQDAYNYLQEYNPQILMFGLKEIRSNNSVEFKRFDFKYYSSNEEFKQDYVSKISGIKISNGFLCNKIYLREFIVKNGFKIPDLRIQQDEVFNLSIYPYVETVLTVKDVFYIYYIYDFGNTRSHYIRERLDIYKAVRNAFLNLETNWLGKNIELEKFIYSRFYNCIFDVIGFNLFHKENSLPIKEKIKIIKNIFKDEDIGYSLQYAKKIGVKPKGLFGKAYFISICNRNVFQFLIVRNIHKIANLIK